MSYLIVFNVIFLCFLMEKYIKMKKIYLKYFICLFLCLFLCFSYFNGSDWRHYEKSYYFFNFSNFLEYEFEKGYSFYISIYRFFNINFFPFFIFNKILCFLCFFYVIKKYSENIYFALLIFFTQLSLYLFIDCPFRNLIAISIFIIAISYIEKKVWLFYFYIFLGYFFHNSIIIFVILPPLLFLYKKLKVNKFILILIFLTLIFLFSNGKYIFLIISKLSFSPTLQWRLYNYLGTNYAVEEVFSIRSIRLIEKIIIGLIGILNRKEIENNFKYGRNILFFTLIFIILFRIGITIPILGRVALYLRLFYVIFLTYILKILKNKVIRTFYIIGFYIYSLGSIIILTNETYVYLPYTSYLKYIFQEKPSYNYRDNYNKNYFKMKREKK